MKTFFFISPNESIFQKIKKRKKTNLYFVLKQFFNIWMQNIWNISINKIKVDTEFFDLDIKVEGYKKIFFGKPNYDFLYVGNVHESFILKDK